MRESMVRSAATLAVVTLCAGFGALSVGCSGDKAPADKVPADDEATATYSTRAQVVSLDGSGDNVRVTLEHEAIEAFKNREGKAQRMPAMKMAFGLAPTVDTTALTPGSKHEVKFDVVWGREPTIRVLEATPLPLDTELTLGGVH